MKYFNLEKTTTDQTTLLSVGFADNPGSATDIMSDIQSYLSENENDLKGSLLKVNGRISGAGAMLIAAELKNKFSAIALFDPKENQYVVVSSVGSEFSVGAMID